MFRKLLIANRGEIACRIARTARRLGMTVIGVYSEADAGARHVRLCDEAWPIGPAAAEQSYLNARAILEVARRCDAQAIHPGYGFLSENQHFAAACAAAGIVFVGPSAAAMAAMGDKAAAKERMRRAGVPVLEGYQGEEQELAELERRGRELGFPLIIKPSGGGGGKGMQIVREPGELTAALEAARRLAVSAFGDERLLLERYLPAPRHVEVQVLADREGRVLHLLDRDCSVQRRHQKLIEEAPAPGLEPALRRGLAEAATTVAREIGYEGAGTVEFLVEGNGFFFMEMNTRLQVEHPVTEAITAIDLVEWQLRIAAGERLEIPQAHLAAHGHAVEARVCAEDPARDFLPGAGPLRFAAWPPERHGVRCDFGFETGDEVPSHYDSLLGKVIAHAPTRAEAIARLRAALGATFIAGVPTNIDWLAGALDSAEFRAGAVDTAFITRHGARLRDAAAPLAPLAAAAVALARLTAGARASPWSFADGFRLGGPQPFDVQLSGAEDAPLLQVRILSSTAAAVLTSEGPMGIRLEDSPEVAGAAADAGRLLALRASSGGPRVRALVSASHIDVWLDGRHASFQSRGVDTASASTHAPAGSLTTTLPGVIVSVQASAGQRVTAGQTLLVVEAMKMEHAIRAPAAGVIATVHVRLGERVREGETLVTMQASAGATPSS